MARRYSEAMRRFQSLPQLWLLSDERNDAVLEEALRRLPRGSGFVYRHYHLGDPERWARFRALRRIARTMDHWMLLADSALTAREWGADGIYGAPRSLYPRRSELVQIATAHGMDEIAQANRHGADAIMLSPAFATRSHPGSPSLGPARFRMLARHAQMPVIALGGMNDATAQRLDWPRWAAIDGLS
ncbi:thiamine phosphate synthase [Altererythrobacter arenosus]|uniref:Thiamine phosphate synthase n=1 Tax=Altererythrobacter arenosus TaxID=3032592 RepID=A0ABY8FVH9_9SPHN|nr:thiamine phosphate synthase [Altererythrobacter sp. CAU 1644]WFL79018.1 thiamine phosphate synthase [Altererythrobacter sp. CAU 1644]